MEDPDGAGPLSCTDPAVFVPDADPTTTTAPLDSDTDDGGVDDPTPVVPDVTRPLIFYQIVFPTNSLNLTKVPDGTLAITY